jgi:hypothetical protein
MPTPDLGCRTKSTNINTTTIHGKRRTTPSGTEILELPFNLSGRRKNANRDVFLLFDFPSSSIGTFGAEGKRLITRCTKLIVATVWEAQGEVCLERGAFVGPKQEKRGCQSRIGIKICISEKRN